MDVLWTLLLNGTTEHFTFSVRFYAFLRRTEASNFFTPIIFVMTRISSHIFLPPFCILAPCSHPPPPPCPGKCPSCPRDLRSQRAVEMFGPLFFIQAATKCCCCCCCCCCCWRDALTHCHWNTHIKLSCTVNTEQSSSRKWDFWITLKLRSLVKGQDGLNSVAKAERGVS